LSISYQEFSLRANRKGFIGLQVLPAIGVMYQQAKFLRVKIASVLGPIEDTHRNPDGTYKRSDFEWDQDSYLCEEHGVEETLDDALLKIYPEIRAEQIKVERAINRVLQALEQEIAAAVFNTTTWTGSAYTLAAGVVGGSSALPWSTKASAIPIQDIDGAIEKVKANCGVKPNALVVTDYGLRKLKRTDQIENLLKYSGHDDPKDLGSTAGLAELFGLEKIIVADGFYNANSMGATAGPSLTRLWDRTMAMVCHISDSQDIEDPEPRIGNTIFFSEENAAIPSDGDGEGSLVIEEYREEDRRGGTYRARDHRQVKILHPEAGFLITGVTA
jgi:hypothetical protein